MGDMDSKHRLGPENIGSDGLDRALDSALAKYAAVEPRAGLEKRILTNLRSSDSSANTNPWWRWGLALAAMMLLIAAGVLWRLHTVSHPTVTTVPAALREQVRRSPHPESKVPTETKLARVHKRGIGHTAPVMAAVPKLDQFPSPRPLSEQEKILAMYINQDPEHAALIAEARMEALRQDEADKMRASSTE